MEEAEELRRLLRVVSGDLNFRLLKVLAAEKVSPIELSERLDMDYSTVRTQLMKLKRVGFVDYEEVNPYHLYFVRKELPSIFHEFLLFYVIKASQLETEDIPRSARNIHKDSCLNPENLKNLGIKLGKIVDRTLAPPDFSNRRLRELLENQGEKKRR